MRDFQGQTRSFLKRLSPRLRSRIQTEGRRQLYHPRDPIIEQGEAPRSLFLIESGRVEITTTSEVTERRSIALVGQGEVVGDIAVLDGGPRTASVIAQTMVAGIHVDGSLLEDLMAREPEFLLVLAQEVCAKLRDTIELYEATTARSCDVRLARSVIRLCRSWGWRETEAGKVLNGQFTQTDLAKLSGLSRETVNRVMRQWREDGIVGFRAGEITVLKAPSLAGVAGAPVSVLEPQEPTGEPARKPEGAGV